MLPRAREAPPHQQETRNAKFKKFLDNVKGIFYYATPHYGCKTVNRLGDLIRSPLLLYFKTLSEDTTWINHMFDDLCKVQKWHFSAVGETHPTNLGFGQVMVVPEVSARGEVEKFSVVDGVDHFSITRPKSKTKKNFTKLKDFLSYIANNTKVEGKSRKEVSLLEEAGANILEKFQSLPKYVVGMDSQRKHIIGRLENVWTVGLVGMQGVGKTTLAMAVFNELKPTFEYTCFVPNVRMIKGDIASFKDTMWKWMHYHGKKVGEQLDWSLLREKRLLLVLDDISADHDTQFLQEIHDVASPKSRFILTSRHQASLRHLDDLYNVPLLKNDSAEHLFRIHAFPDDGVPRKFSGLMTSIAQYCEGLPLALTVLGMYLRTKKTTEEWGRTLDRLDKAADLKNFQKWLSVVLGLCWEVLEDTEKRMLLESPFCKQESEILQENEDLYDWYDDPITMDMMCDPVNCSDGWTYDRWTIVDQRLRKSPYNRNLKTFDILCDDMTTRSRLFRKFPEQEAKYLQRRKKYREEALQHARANPVEFQDAIEKLNNVLKWLPIDKECENELATILDLVSKQPSLLDAIPSTLNTTPNQQASPSDTTPVIMHEDVMRARMDSEGTRWVAFLVFFYMLFWVFVF